MPEHLGADEKIIWLGITQVCVPATVGGGCVLGISLITKTVYETFSMLSQWRGSDGCRHKIRWHQRIQCVDECEDNQKGPPVSGPELLNLFDWEAGSRTPIGGSRVRSLTIRRPPKKDLRNIWAVR